VYRKRPTDSALLIPAIESHQGQLGRVPRLLVGDAGFYSAGNEKAAHGKGVKCACVPNRSTTRA
jgi:IS5 family transposase